MSERSEAMLDVRDVTVRFGGINALTDVSFQVGAGEAVGLVGPNGAGKTTLFNCLLGMVRPNRGRIMFDGQDLTRLPTYKRARLGIGRTFQRVELFAGMTVREHLLVAERSRRGDGSLLKDMLNKGRPSTEEISIADETLALSGIERVRRPARRGTDARPVAPRRARARPRRRPETVAARRAVVGARRGRDAGAGKVLADVRAERGTAILLVEHDLDLVRRAVDRLHVLDFGRTIAAGDMCRGAP